MNKIKCTVKEGTNKKVKDDIKEIEKHKDDSNRCHQSLRKIKLKKPKKPLITKDKAGKIVGLEKCQVNLMTESKNYSLLMILH